MQYPGLNSGFIENHESTIYYNERGEKNEKSHLSARSKEERENLLIWQFVKHVNGVYQTKFPPHWKERDAPHDYTFQDHQGNELIVEQISIGNHVVGSMHQDMSRRIQGMRQQIQRKLDGLGLGRGHLVIFHAHMSHGAIRSINNAGIEVIDEPPTADQLKNWISESVTNDKVVIIEQAGLTAVPNIFHFDSGTIETKAPYGELIKQAVYEKQGKGYPRESEMVLLIDDRTTWYTKKEFDEFAESAMARQIAKHTRFNGVYVIASHGGGILARNSDFHIMTIKHSPKLLKQRQDL